MINQSTILIAQPIAEELVANNKSLTSRVGKIIQGLNQESQAFVEYDLNTLPLTVPEVTMREGGHSPLMEGLSDGLAQLVGNSFTNISNYLIPLSKKLIDATATATDYESNVSDIIFRELCINYVKLDQPFFLSPFYPDGFAEGTVDFNSIPLADLRFKGTYAPSNEDALNELVKISNDDILEIINNYPPASLFKRIVVGGDWSELFGDSIGTVNFNKFVMTDPGRLFSLYIAFSRLNANEEPIDGITGIELDDYRSWVQFVLNCLTYALVQVRNTFKVYAGSSFPVLSSDVKKSDAGVKGSITIGVTAKAIEEFSANPDTTTISEAIVGRAMVQTLDLNVSTDGFDLVKNKAVFGDVFRTHQKALVESFSSKIRSSLVSQVEAVINSFQRENPQFLPFINQNVESVDEYNRLYSGVRSEADQFVNSFIEACIVRDVRAEEFVMGSHLVPAVAAKIGLGFAADILRESSVTGAGELSEASQREMLSGAVARVLVNYVINN